MMKGDIFTGSYAYYLENTSFDSNPFKVGDRIRCIKSMGNPHLVDGVVYIVEGISEENVDVGHNVLWLANRFELVTDEPHKVEPITLDDELFEL